jgi:hypothetical protein
VQQRYHFEQVRSDAKELSAQFDPTQIGVLEALNRADAVHLPTLKELIVPDSWHADLRMYSPFPGRIGPWGADLPRLVIVHQPGQAFAAYENGLLVRWGPVSTCRSSRTSTRSS